jgi:hypothetical protein
LAAIVGDRNRPHKHIQRVRIIPLSAERLPVAEVALRAGINRPTVWRWQKRYGEAGVDGLLGDKTRPPGRPPLLAATVATVLALTYCEPPDEATHWTGRAGQESGDLVARGAAHLASPWPPAAPHPHTRPRREGGGYSRSLYGPAGPCHRVVD